MVRVARVFDGQSWTGIFDHDYDDNRRGQPVKPYSDGDGKIFVSIPSYRDGERCGETLKSLFENAENPDNIVVGLVEQNAPEDKFCLEAYCESYGAHTLKRQTVREGVTKVITNDDARTKCPYYDQVRLVAYHNIQAKGPSLARSMARKVLGNEEFCMQIDAHSVFVKGWDTLVKEQWDMTENEFGVISNVPADLTEKDSYTEDPQKLNEVPRQCSIKFLDNGFPNYLSPGDGKVANLEKPLLGHGWSAAFSFAKCHLEESAPYDNFSVWAMPIEQFSRFARMWTRGYDVYTPTRNIVFHDYGPQKNGHGDNEWFKRQRDRFRKSSLERVKTMLQMPGGLPNANDQANLGIYGLGRRRTIEQLTEFCNIDLQNRRGNHGSDSRCAGHEWIPYDESISPTENLYTNPDNLDPQPVYPLRTNLIFYQQILEVIPADNVISEQQQRVLPGAVERPDTFGTPTDPMTGMPPISILLVFWVFGLMVWYLMFMAPSNKSRSSNRKKSAHYYKDV